MHYVSFYCVIKITTKPHTREYRHVESVLYEQYVP